VLTKSQYFFYFFLFLLGSSILLLLMEENHNESDKHNNYSPDMETTSNISSNINLVSNKSAEILSVEQLGFNVLATLLEDGKNRALIEYSSGEHNWIFSNQPVNDHWSISIISRNSIQVTNSESYKTLYIKQGEQYNFDPALVSARQRLSNPNFKEKINIYLNGRHPTEVEFPAGVATNGIGAISQNEFYIDRYLVFQQLLDKKPHRHIKYKFSESGMGIEEIVPGSLFDLAGLKSGDEIIGVGDKKIDSFSQLLAIYPNFFTEDLITIKLNRNNNEHQFQFNLFGKTSLAE